MWSSVRVLFTIVLMGVVITGVSLLLQAWLYRGAEEVEYQITNSGVLLTDIPRFNYFLRLEYCTSLICTHYDYGLWTECATCTVELISTQIQQFVGLHGSCWVIGHNGKWLWGSNERGNPHNGFTAWLYTFFGLLFVFLLLFVTIIFRIIRHEREKVRYHDSLLFAWSCGMHHRLGNNSSLHTHFSQSSIYDRNVLHLIKNFVQKGKSNYSY